MGASTQGILRLKLCDQEDAGQGDGEWATSGHCPGRVGGGVEVPAGVRLWEGPAQPGRGKLAHAGQEVLVEMGDQLFTNQHKNDVLRVGRQVTPTSHLVVFFHICVKGILLKKGKYS